MAIDATKLKKGRSLGAPPSDANPQLIDEPDVQVDKATEGHTSTSEQAHRSVEPQRQEQVSDTPSVKERSDSEKPRSRKGEAWGMPRPGEPIAKLGIDLTTDVRRRFKAKAAGEGYDGSDLVREWIRRYLGDEQV